MEPGIGQIRRLALGRSRRRHTPYLNTNFTSVCQIDMIFRNMSAKIWSSVGMFRSTATFGYSLAMNANSDSRLPFEFSVPRSRFPCFERSLEIGPQFSVHCRRVTLWSSHMKPLWSTKPSLHLTILHNLPTHINLHPKINHLSSRFCSMWFRSFSTSQEGFRTFVCDFVFPVIPWCSVFCDAIQLLFLFPLCCTLRYPEGSSYCGVFPSNVSEFSPMCTCVLSTLHVECFPLSQEMYVQLPLSLFSLRVPHPCIRIPW